MKDQCSISNLEQMMKTYFNLICLIVLPLLIGAAFILFYCKGEPFPEDPELSVYEEEPVVQVSTIKLQKGEIRETISAYGKVLPLPDKLKTVSVPYTIQVETMQVDQGQMVQQGQLLLTLKPGADAVLQLQQAQSELNAALLENKLLQERIKLKLATRQNLFSSRLRVEQAQVKLDNLRNRGIGEQQDIKADRSGIIYQVNVQQGQIVSAGTPLLQLVDQNHWVVRLGIEPEDYSHLQVNQPVLVTPVNTSLTTPVKGRIEMITHQIDPSTGLLNVYVRPDSNRSLLINSFVKGRIIVAARNTLLVPREAILPDDGGYSLFTIADGRAVEHKVKVGLENDIQVEVISGDLEEQDEVVILGNYQLQQGMAVAMTSNPPVDREDTP